MKNLIIRRSWIESSLEDLDEARTLVRLSLAVGEALLTRNFSRRAGTESDTINVPLLPMAFQLAESWWQLLYEPFRGSAARGFRTRHRLDGAMNGFAFPVLALCSGGPDSVLAEWGLESESCLPIEFLTPPSVAPETLRRDLVEELLLDLIETTLERLPRNGRAHQSLMQTWTSVRDSMGDAEELAYCRLAGRLGLDPYDDTTPDITALTTNLSAPLLEDISEAAFLEELQGTTDWVRNERDALESAPSIDLSSFGVPTVDDLDKPAWAIGYAAAQELKSRVGLDPTNPRRELEGLLGDILTAQNFLAREGPPSINVLIKRNGNIGHIGTVARSAREQRFKACTGAYIAWLTNQEDVRAATPAFTRRQQTGRAFAAEMLVPRSYLLERAPTHGFTSDQIEEIAGEIICPHATVAWQAFNAGIPLRDGDEYRRQPSLV